MKVDGALKGDRATLRSFCSGVFESASNHFNLLTFVGIVYWLSARGRSSSVLLVKG